MTVRECYEQMEGNYDEVLARLVDDARIKKYLNMFMQDESYQKLCTAIEEKDYGKAFEHAHNLKGVGMNLAFVRFYASANVLCEALRGGSPTENVEVLLAPVKEEYEKVISAIRQLL